MIITFILVNFKRTFKLRLNLLLLFILAAIFLKNIITSGLQFNAIVYAVNTYIPFFTNLILANLIVNKMGQWKGDITLKKGYNDAFKLIYGLIVVITLSVFITHETFVELIMRASSILRGEGAGGNRSELW